MKFFKKLALSLGMLGFLGGAISMIGTPIAHEVCAAEEIYYTLDGTQTGGNNAYATESEIIQNEMTWSVCGNTDISPWRIGGKSLTGVDREVYSKTVMGSAITKVELTTGTASITVNSLKLIVASNTDFSTSVNEVSATFAANSTITFTPTSPAATWATGAYYKFVFNVTVSGSSNKFVQFTEAKFYRETPTDPISVNNVSLNKSSISLYVGQTETLTATVEPSDASNKNVNWESSDPAIATVNDKGLVTAKAVGGTTITVRTEEGNFTDSCVVTVEAAPLSLVDYTTYNSINTIADITYEANATVNGYPAVKCGSSTKAGSFTIIVSTIGKFNLCIVGWNGENVKLTCNAIEIALTSNSAIAGKSTDFIVNSSAEFLYHFNVTTAGSYIFTVTADKRCVVWVDTVQSFIENYMHMSEYADDNTYDFDRCSTNYTKAKQAFDNLSSEDQAAFLDENGPYTAARERFLAWAAANGDNINGTQPIRTISPINNSTTPLFVILASITVITSIGAFFILRRKSTN